MKTQFYTATSIDGYIADDENALDWLFQFELIESMKDNYDHFISQVGAAAMGSTTYEWIIEQENMVEHPEKWPYTFPVWVFSSRTQPIINGADITFVKGGVEPIYSDMMQAADGKNIWLIGGGGLGAQFHNKGLLDEIILNVVPVILGSGAQLFSGEISSPPLKLVDAEKHGDVFMMLRYEVQK
ncbi:MAG: dihydrofolate reductase family protein [Gracilimonas sp.]|nr:dihydrofolate reductase family protein [Gracilimonas sp.]